MGKSIDSRRAMRIICESATTIIIMVDLGRGSVANGFGVIARFLYPLGDCCSICKGRSRSSRR